MHERVCWKHAGLLLTVRPWLPRSKVGSKLRSAAVVRLFVLDHEIDNVLACMQESTDTVAGRMPCGCCCCSRLAA